MTKDYRFDNRSKNEFINDIQNATEIESNLMDFYVSWLNNKRDPGSPEYFRVDTGIDNSGGFIEKASDVDCRPDFLLGRNGYDYQRHIDIKFSRPTRSGFHLKVSQMKQYIKEDCAVVMFMGIETDKMKFCIITPHELQVFLDTKTPVRMWHKQCIKLTNGDVNWITP